MDWKAYVSSDPQVMHGVDIRTYPPSAHPGVWVLRPAMQSIADVLSLLETALPLLDREPVRQRLWIVEPARVRIRA